MNTKQVVHVIWNAPGIKEMLTRHLPTTQFEFLRPGDSLKDVEILLFDQEVVDTIPLFETKSLKWAQSTFAGVDSIITSAKKKNIKPTFALTRAGGIHGRYMAEYTLGQIICSERKFSKMAKNQQNCAWKKYEYRGLNKLTLLIVGLGSIGQTVGRLCYDAGMTIHGVGRRHLAPNDLPSCISKYWTIAELPQSLAAADYICSILPSTDATKGLFDNQALQACASRKSVFINIGRGDAISEDTILEALSNGWIRQAILDVFPVEPLEPASGLWSHPQVIVTPHVSGLTFADDLVGIFAENYQRFQDNEPFLYQVDWAEEMLDCSLRNTSSDEPGYFSAYDFLKPFRMFFESA